MGTPAQMSQPALQGEMGAFCTRLVVRITGLYLAEVTATTD